MDSTSLEKNAQAQLPVVDGSLPMRKRKDVVEEPAATKKANELRKKHNLKWNQVKFKADRSRSSSSASSGKGRIDYAPRINPSKGRRFRGRYDAFGNYADID